MPESVHSGSASWDNCGRTFPDKLHVSSSPDWFPHCLHSGIACPLQLHWVKGVCVFKCNLPPALLVERLGSFTCHCGNMGVEWTPNKSQHTKLTLEKIILLPPLPGFELAFNHKSSTLTNKPSQHPWWKMGRHYSASFNQRVHIQRGNFGSDFFLWWRLGINIPRVGGGGVDKITGLYKTLCKLRFSITKPWS